MSIFLVPLLWYSLQSLCSGNLNVHLLLHAFMVERSGVTSSESGFCGLFFSLYVADFGKNGFFKYVGFDCYGNLGINVLCFLNLFKM